MTHKIMSLGTSNIVSKAKRPTVTLVAPISGPAAGGTAITITGTNFKKSANPAFRIGGVLCTSVVVVSKTSVTAVTGAHAAAAGLNVVCQNANNGDGYGLNGTGVALFEYT